MKRGRKWEEDEDKRGVGKFTICKRVKTLWGDDHLSSAALVLIFPVGNLRRTMLCERVILHRGNRSYVLRLIKQMQFSRALSNAERRGRYTQLQ